jgi:hypothetical protein
MNLVAKEFIASQNPDDPGVLVLSRFAGAAQECKPALLVNPYDPDSVAAAIGQGLSISLAERRERHALLFQTLSRRPGGQMGAPGRSIRCGSRDHERPFGGGRFDPHREIGDQPCRDIGIRFPSLFKYSQPAFTRS